MSHTLDVILINGRLSIGDNIIIHTNKGTINAIIKNLLTPPPNKESRIPSEYISHDFLDDTMGIKLVANIEGSVSIGKKIIKNNELGFTSLNFTNELEHNEFVLDNKGVTVHASSLGSLEALLKFLQKECNPPIQVANIKIGNVAKKDIIKTYITNEKNPQELKSVLAFNVLVDSDAIIEAKDKNVKIFTADIIYHLFNDYIKYDKETKDQRKESVKHKMIFPCILNIIPTCIFNKKNPLVFGVDIVHGSIHIGTPLTTEKQYIGKVIGIQNEKKDVTVGKQGMSVCIKVENQDNQTITYGRHFDDKDTLYSQISRESLDIMKEHFRSDISKDDVLLFANLKKILNIK